MLRSISRVAIISHARQGRSRSSDRFNLSRTNKSIAAPSDCDLDKIYSSKLGRVVSSLKLAEIMWNRTATGSRDHRAPLPSGCAEDIARSLENAVLAGIYGRKPMEIQGTAATRMSPASNASIYPTMGFMPSSGLIPLIAVAQ